MKIDKLKVNGFGKLNKREFTFEKNINIIHGNNEAGKSSLLKFITGMFYGASKNKNGKEISDFDKYKPWNTEDFSGKIQYELDNGNVYEVYRDFKKKNPIIYDNNQQDISKEFSMDKTKGIDFFTEQTGIDENTFFNTAISEQEGLRLSKNGQNGIIQKISNLISTGDDNISYKKSYDKLSRMQTEKIGTERTSQRPLNKVTELINKLISRKNELETNREKVQSSIETKEQLEKELIEEREKEKFLKRIKTSLENNRIRFAEINVNKNLEKEYEEKIEFLNGKIDENAESNIKKKKVNLKIYYIVLAIFVAISVAIFVLIKNLLIDVLSIVPIVIVVILMICKVLKNKKDMQNKINELAEIRSNIAKEIKVLTETKDKKGKE